MRLFGPTIRPVTIAFGALVGVLTTALVACTLSGTRVATLLATAPIRLSTPALGFQAQPAPLDSSGIDGATLFYATRRFRPPPSTPPAIQPPPYHLIGTLLMPGRPALAFLKNDTTSASLKVTNGDMLQGWKVEAVASQGIIITSGNERREIGRGSQGIHPSVTSASIRSTTLTSGRATSLITKRSASIRTLGNAQVLRPSVIHSPPRHAVEDHHPAPAGYVNPGERLNVNQLYRGPGL